MMRKAQAAKDTVSPVYAGIDLFIRAMIGPTVGFPRICGDRPLQKALDIEQEMFPPYMRG